MPNDPNHPVPLNYARSQTRDGFTPDPRTRQWVAVVAILMLLAIVAGAILEVFAIIQEMRHL